MGDPYFARFELADGHGELVPVGVIGNDERQLDVALARALADPHPARSHRRHRVREPARPAVVERSGRGDHDVPRHFLLGCTARVAEFTKVYAEALIELVQPLDRTMEVDGVTVPALAQFADNALCFPERVRANQNAAARIGMEAV